MLLTAPSSIEHRAAQYGQSSIEHRAARQLSDNRKKYRCGGIEPADGIIACDNLAGDLGKSQPQPSILQTICNVNAGVCHFLNKCLLPPAADIPMHSLWAAKVTGSIDNSPGGCLLH